MGFPYIFRIVQGRINAKGRRAQLEIGRPLRVVHFLSLIHIYTTGNDFEQSVSQLRSVIEEKLAAL